MTWMLVLQILVLVCVPMFFIAALITAVKTAQIKAVMEGLAALVKAIAELEDGEEEEKDGGPMWSWTVTKTTDGKEPRDS